MNNTTNTNAPAAAKPAVPVSLPRDYTVRLIGGIKVALAFSEYRKDHFGAAAHVAVQYLTPGTNGRRLNVSFGWLPVEMWEGGQTIATTATEHYEVWN